MNRLAGAADVVDVAAEPTGPRCACCSFQAPLLLLRAVVVAVPLCFRGRARVTEGSYKEKIEKKEQTYAGRG